MLRTFVLAFAALVLTGCHHDWEYSAPPLSLQATAIITGSKLRNPDALKPDTRAYPVAIDGKLTGGGPSGWDGRIAIAPGAHDIRFGVGSVTAWGFGNAHLVVEAGKSYVIRAAEPVTVGPLCTSTTAWLEGDDGTVLTDKVPVMIATYTGSEVPIGGGGFIASPSRTVCPPR